MSKFDYLIVGAGAWGATFARKAADAGKKCLVIDKRSHIAGNCYTERRHGINVHMYGAHIFHTRNETVWAFANTFAAFNTFVNKPKVLAGGTVYSFPVNLMTLHQLWGVTTPAEAKEKLEQVRIPCPKPRNLEEWALAQVGREIYDLFIYGYTKKQWLKEPRELPISILTRLPIHLTYNENYFTTPYQGVPVGGYTSMFECMLDGIQLEIGTDFDDLRDWKKYAKRLVFTGPLDRFFNYEFGELEWRTLKFEHTVVDGDFQGNAVFNHPSLDTPYIRTVEHKHFEATNTSKSILTYDIPMRWDRSMDPQYPIRDRRNSQLCARYRTLVSNTPDVIFGGRLGEYKYYDIDQAMASAISRAKDELDV